MDHGFTLATMLTFALLTLLMTTRTGLTQVVLVTSWSTVYLQLGEMIKESPDPWKRGGAIGA